MFYAIANRPSPAFQRRATPVVSNSPLDRFLSDTLSSLSDAGAAQAATVEDLDKSYTLQLDVPGLAKEQLDIGIEGDVLRVTSKADAPRHVKAAWRFPLEIDVSGSTAKLEHGVLTMTLAKKIPVSNIAQLAIE